MTCASQLATTSKLTGRWVALALGVRGSVQTGLMGAECKGAAWERQGWWRPDGASNGDVHATAGPLSTAEYGHVAGQPVQRAWACAGRWAQPLPHAQRTIGSAALLPPPLHALQPGNSPLLGRIVFFDASALASRIAPNSTVAFTITLDIRRALAAVLQSSAPSSHC